MKLHTTQQNGLFISFWNGNWSWNRNEQMLFKISFLAKQNIVFKWQVEKTTFLFLLDVHDIFNKEYNKLQIYPIQSFLKPGRSEIFDDLEKHSNIIVLQKSSSLYNKLPITFNYNLISTRNSFNTRYCRAINFSCLIFK